MPASLLWQPTGGPAPMSAANATAERQGAYLPPEAGMVLRGKLGEPTENGEASAACCAAAGGDEAGDVVGLATSSEAEPTAKMTADPSLPGRDRRRLVEALMPRSCGSVAAYVADTT